MNVYLDGEFAFGLNMLDAALLRKGQILSDEDITRLREQDAVVKAFEQAVNYLSYRPRSRQEIQQYLTGKTISPDIQEHVIARLEHAGYLDDRAFARLWIESRTRSQPRGPQALRYELRQKGIAPALIEELLRETVDVDAVAYQAASDHGRRLRGLTQREYRQKMGAFLQRRGFAYSTASHIIRRLIEELAEAEPPFFGVADASDEDDE
ncbi:regulatory protein RecX [bacterium]|nr:regulatory protein RecX [bacterium]